MPDTLKPFHSKVCLTAHPYFTMGAAAFGAPTPPSPQGYGLLGDLLWTDDSTHLTGRTSTGRATIEALRLNRPLVVRARQRWVSAGWHPPDDAP